MSLADKKVVVVKEVKKSHPGNIKSIIIDDFFSAALRRRVKLEILLPPWYEELPHHHFPVLYLNDGQVLKQMRLVETLMDSYQRNDIPPVIIVAIHANSNRMNEYGVASTPDFKKRGIKAAKYTRFVIHELRNLINNNFRTLKDASHNSIAGYSLGGLSAFDIAWHHPELFNCVGVFSGSFWWRSKSYLDGYNDETDRIMHQVVKQSKWRPHIRFWFQCGTLDEIADRNKNDVIDAIDDTLDLMKELKVHGYLPAKDMHYVEVVNGRHHESTWADVMPLFLEWAFGKKK